MLSFILTGAISGVLTNDQQTTTLVVSSLVARADTAPRQAWILCDVRDPRSQNIAVNLHNGDLVRIEGEIEQHRRQVGELAFHSLSFIARVIERAPAPDAGDAP